MKKSYIIILLLLCVAGFITGGLFFDRESHSDEPTTIVEVFRDTVVDTIRYYTPVPKDSIVIRYFTERLPVSPDTAYIHDSIAVVIPITQKTYADSTYTAWVSGYQPQLDSITIYPRTINIREREYKPPNRWHIGVSAGYGYTRQGFSPYIGVGITYSIISF